MSKTEFCPLCNEFLSIGKHQLTEIDIIPASLQSCEKCNTIVKPSCKWGHAHYFYKCPDCGHYWNGELGTI